MCSSYLELHLQTAACYNCFVLILIENPQKLLKYSSIFTNMFDI